MNITLIGMPGSGKSFVGGKLADRLGYALVEVDKIIEREFDLPLQQIVEKLGNEMFLDKEAETVVKNTVAKSNLVVSPGGSVIYRQYAMEHLKKISKIFYLKVPMEILEERIAGVARGIINTKNKTFADLYMERVPLYEKFADYVLRGDANPETICDNISSALV